MSSRHEKRNGEGVIIEREKSYSVCAEVAPMVFWDTIGSVHNKALGFRFGHGFGGERR